MKMKFVYGGLALLLLITGVAVYKVVSGSAQAPVVEEEPVEELPQVDAFVIVDVTKSRSKDNTVVLSVSKLGSKYSSVAYELTYESQGLIKGVNSGSKPIDVAGKDSFEREVYLGTCSRNVCKPDPGVKSVSVVLEFTDSSGKRSQFSKEYEI